MRESSFQVLSFIINCYFPQVWDLVEQNCLVSLNPKLHKISGEIQACVYADACKTIALATDHVSLLKIAQK